MSGNSSKSTEKLLWMEKRKEVRSQIPAIMAEKFDNYHVSLVALSGSPIPHP